MSQSAPCPNLRMGCLRWAKGRVQQNEAYTQPRTSTNSRAPHASTTREHKLVTTRQHRLSTQRFGNAPLPADGAP
eukprot:2588925-Prymnesium_polylepis.4